MVMKGNPYWQCEKCKDLSDCPCPEISLDMFGVPLPPDVCPRPMDIMKETEKNRKLLKKYRHGLS
jgi:hypothetical protein